MVATGFTYGIGSPHRLKIALVFVKAPYFVMEELLTFYTVVLILALVDGWLAGLAVIIRLISAELASSWDVAKLDNKKFHKAGYRTAVWSI